MKTTKKLLLVTLVLVFVLALAPMAYADQINVSIDGQPVNFADQTPTIIDGRTLVPVRDVFEALGFEVDWDDVTRTATLTGDDYVVTITVGRRTFTTNGANHTLDVPAQIIGGRTMLPISAILESVGYYVGWNERTRTVIVRSEPLGSNSIYDEDIEFVVEYHNPRAWNLPSQDLIVRNTDEWLNFAEKYISTVIGSDPFNIKGYFLEITAEFDDDFFAERMLILISVSTSTLMCGVEIDGVTIDKDNLLNVHTTITNTAEISLPAVATHFFIISIPQIEDADIVPYIAPGWMR